MADIDKERAAFEAWAFDKVNSLMRGAYMGGYYYADAHAAWEAWKFRASLPPENTQGHQAELRGSDSPSSAAEFESLRAENARLIEDRARFPDRPDDIGSMIGAHFGNLKAAAKSHEDAWYLAQVQCDVLASTLAAVAGLKRRDPNKHRSNAGRWAVLNVPVELMQRIDALVGPAPTGEVEP